MVVVRVRTDASMLDRKLARNDSSLRTADDQTTAMKCRPDTVVSCGVVVTTAVAL